jgi:hypothetical protein
MCSSPAGRSKPTVHGRQRSSLSVATGLRRRCSADGQGQSANSPTPHEPPRQRVAHRFAQARRGATEGGSGRSPTVECGSSRRWAHTERQPNAPWTASESRWRVSAQIGPPPASRLSGESRAVFGRCQQPPVEHDGSRHFSHPASRLIARVAVGAHAVSRLAAKCEVNDPLRRGAWLCKTVSSRQSAGRISLH